MDSEEDIVEILREARTIAVVGCSPKPYRASHSVARYLMDEGYRVVPVNPAHDELLDVKTYADLAAARDGEGRIDIVDIFRAAHLVRPHVEEAVTIGTRLIWMQMGIVNEPAAKLAREAGIAVIMDECIRVRHAKLKRQGKL